MATKALSDTFADSIPCPAQRGKGTLLRAIRPVVAIGGDPNDRGCEDGSGQQKTEENSEMG